MHRGTSAALAGALLLLAPSLLPAQRPVPSAPAVTRAERTPPRGRALYDLMARALTTTEGSAAVRWLPGGEGYVVAQGTGAALTYQKVDPATGATTPFLDDAALRAIAAATGGAAGSGLPFRSFEVALDGKALLLTRPDSSVWLYDRQARTARRLMRPAKRDLPAVDGLLRNLAGSQLLRGSYSADYGQYAYVQGYDLYVMDTRTGAERAVSTGGSDSLLNGRPDWVYPEEFGQLETYWFSPDGSKLAYLQFDEQPVRAFPIVHELEHAVELERQRYPLAGAPNPVVRLFVADLRSGKTTAVDTKSTSDNYILRPTWTPDGRALLFQRLNRRQNRLELLSADPASGATRPLLVEEEPEFVNLHDDLHLFPDGRFLWSSERSGWRHLYLYDATGRQLRQLTSGEWPVGEVSLVDEAGGWVYFTGYDTRGLDRHLMRVKLDGGAVQRLTTEPGVHAASIDPTGRWFVDSWSSLAAPPRAVLRTTDSRQLRELSRTSVARLDSLGLAAPELVTVKAADGTTELNGLLYKPADFDPQRKYPVVVSVYGGPHSQRVSNSFRTTAGEQRLAQMGFLVWILDNRGTPNRGKKFETATYLKLGQVDLDDQAAGVRQLAAARPYVDAERVGIYGGSYGGYMSALALLKQPDVFHVGVARSSVTDWRNYDAPYTERYMRTPQENAQGYDLGSTLPYAKALRGKLLLVHGSTDNNVHLSNTTQLVQKLLEAGKDFDMMIYPEQRHGIGGVAAQHLAKLQLDYFVEHLRPTVALVP